MIIMKTLALRIQRQLAYALVGMGILIFSPLPESFASIELSGSVLVSAQNVDFDSTTGDLDEDFNFNDPRVNLYFKSKISPNVSLNFALWMSNDWSAENIRGNAGTVVLDDAVELRASFVTIQNIFGKKVDAKFGKVPIPYGYEAPLRVANGDMSRSDFVGNSLMDIHGIDDGILLAGSVDAGISKPLSWEFAVVNGGAVTDGNPSGGTGQTRSNADLAYAARVQSAVMDNLTVQASWYANDLSKDGDNDAMHVGSSFFVNAVQDAAAANKNLVGLVYAGGAQGGGYDRDMWEVSAKYDLEQGYILGFFGRIDADTATAGASRKWEYLGVQARYNAGLYSYLAARWNRLDPDYSGAGALGEPTLISISGGYRLADNAWLKAEWTSFDEGGDGFGNEGTAIGAASAADNRGADATALRLALGAKF